MLESGTILSWFWGAESGTRKSFISNLDRAEEAYYHLIRDQKKGSGMTLPTTTISVNRLVPKLISFIYPQGESLRIPNAGSELTKHFKDKLRIINFRKTIKSWVRRTVIDGTGVLYPFWEDNWEYIKDNLYFDVSEEEVQVIKDGNKDIQREMFLNTFGNSVKRWEYVGDKIKAEMYDDYGKLAEYAITFSTQGQELVMSILGNRLVYSGLKLQVIPIRNLFFPVDTPSLDEAEFVIYQQFCSVEYLSSWVSDKDKLKQARGMQYSSTGIRSPGEGAVTKTGERPEEPFISNVVEMWQVFHGNKITFILPCVGHVFMEMDLEDEFPRRTDLPRRPFFVSRYLEINDRLVFGWSLPLLLYQYQKEMDYLNNLTNDAGDMSTSLFGAYKPTGYNLGEPKKIRLERNTLFPTDEPTKDFHFFNTSPNIAWALQKMAMIGENIERLSQVDEMVMGKASSGASRGEKTLGGMQMLMGQKQEVFMEISWDMRQELEKVLTSMLFLYSRRAPSSELTLIGLDRNSLRSSSVYVDTDLLSSQQVLNRVTSLYQVMRDPLLLQLGVIKPSAFSVLLGKLIKSLGEDPEEYIVTPTIYSPEEHVEMLTSGGMPMPGPGDDHRDHITKEMMAFQKAGMETKKNFLSHIQLHGYMMEQTMQQPQEITLGKYGQAGKQPII